MSKLTARHIGKTFRIQPDMLAGVYRRTINRDLNIPMGAGNCILSFDVMQKPASIASLSNDRTRCLIHWIADDLSMWIDVDLLEKAAN